jgi:hypothetical protein
MSQNGSGRVRKAVRKTASLEESVEARWQGSPLIGSGPAKKVI